MPKARTVLPTDLVALVSYDGRVYANQAITLDRIGSGGSPHPIEAAFEQWFSFATGRHTWISVKGPTLRGLVSARKRGSKQAWEIDCLINAEEDDPGVLMSLLDQVTDAAGRSGAMKIFLRVPTGASVEGEAARCGFAPYKRETVYSRRQPAAKAAPSPPAVRRRAKADEFGAFQLYNALVPEPVRRFEAMTLTEWAAAQETLGRTAQYVADEIGRIGGLLRIAHDGEIGRFDVLAEDAAAEALVEAALTKLANRASLHAIVPPYAGHVARRLIDRGFAADDEFTVLARRTVRRVKEARRAPVVQTTFG